MSELVRTPEVPVLDPVVNRQRRTTPPTRMSTPATVLWTDATWVVDSTPVECGRSRETTKRSEPASPSPGP